MDVLNGTEIDQVRWRIGQLLEMRLDRELNAAEYAEYLALVNRERELLAS